MPALDVLDLDKKLVCLLYSQFLYCTQQTDYVIAQQCSYVSTYSLPAKQKEMFLKGGRVGTVRVV